MIAVSIVSHGHGTMVPRLVNSLLACPEVARILVTRNIPEDLFVASDPRVSLIDNRYPKGFGANHNEAFKYCQEPFFCPVNPDIDFHGNPFPSLLLALESKSAALVAPMVTSPAGGVEDSLRRFPTPVSLLCKAWGGGGGRYAVGRGDPVFFPEWVAGMFMLFRSGDFARLGGFDEGYFLYYEDVDICARAWRAGMKIVACPSVVVDHDARRDSHRKLGHLRWHLASMVRYFMKHWGHLPEVPAR